MHAGEGANENGKSTTADSLEADKLMFNLRFFIAPVTEVSSRLIFRGESYSSMQPGLKSRLMKLAQSLTPGWVFHALTQSTIIDGDMVFLNRQSMQLMHGHITSKDYFMPAASDLCTRELWRHFNTYSKEGINFYPHACETGVIPQEKVLDRYNQHVKDCLHCSAGLAGVRTVMWVAVVVATGALLATGVVAGSCVVNGAFKGWPVGLGAAVVAATALKLVQWMKALEKKFLFEPYIHQDKN